MERWGNPSTPTYEKKKYFYDKKVRKGKRGIAKTFGNSDKCFVLFLRTNKKDKRC